MTTALTTGSSYADLGLSPPTPEDRSVALAAASSKFPPYMQLYGANSNLVKENSEWMGCFGLVYSGNDGPSVNLGKSFDCVVLAARPKAMRLNPLTVVFQIDHPEYLKIKAECDNAPKGEMVGCFHGPEFLIWVPAQKVFVLYHCSNKTSRKEAGNLHAKMLQPITLKSKLIKAPKFSWHGPQCLACDTPLDPPEVNEENREIITRFNERVATLPEISDRVDTGRAR